VVAVMSRSICSLKIMAQVSITVSGIL